MASPIIKTSDFNSQNLRYSSVKTNAQGGKQIYISYSQNGHQVPLIFQTPKMLCMNGLNKFEDKDLVKYSCDISFTNMETDDKVAALYKALSDIDDKIVGDAVNHSMEWLKMKSVTPASLRDLKLYTPSIKLSVNKDSGEPDGKYPPRMKLKIQHKDGDFVPSVYNKNREKVSMDCLEKGSYVKCIVQCSGIWIVNGKFGLSWKLQQIQVEPPTKLGKSFAFLPDSDDEAEDTPEKETEQTSAQDSGSHQSDSEQEQQEENEEQEESDEAPEPAPAPVQVTPVVVETESAAKKGRGAAKKK